MNRHQIVKDVRSIIRSMENRLVELSMLEGRVPIGVVESSERGFLLPTAAIPKDGFPTDGGKGTSPVDTSRTDEA